MHGFECMLYPCIASAPAIALAHDPRYALAAVHWNLQVKAESKQAIYTTVHPVDSAPTLKLPTRFSSAAWSPSNINLT